MFYEYVKEGTKVSEKIIFNFFDDSIEDSIQKALEGLGRELCQIMCVRILDSFMMFQ